MTISDASGRFVVVTLVLLAARVFSAPEQTSSVGSPSTAANQLKALHDPTIVEPSVWLDTEWDHYEHGAEEVTWTMAGLWARRISEWQDWAVRLKLPIVYDRSDAASAHADVGGVGDIEIGTASAFRLSKTWRTAAGIEMHADTASDTALGDSVWRLHSTWSVAHDVNKWLSVTFTADYNHSIAEENNVGPQRYLQVSLPANFILPDDWSVSTNYKAKVNFENGDHWTHTVDLGVAKRLSNTPVVLSVTLEKPLDGGGEKFEADFTVTYYFER